MMDTCINMETKREINSFCWFTCKIVIKKKTNLEIKLQKVVFIVLISQAIVAYLSFIRFYLALLSSWISSILVLVLENMFNIIKDIGKIDRTLSFHLSKYLRILCWKGDMSN